MPKLFRLELPDFPIGGQTYKDFFPLIRAVKTIATVVDNFICGSQSGGALNATFKTIPSSLAKGSLVFVTDSGVVTTDSSKGYNGVHVGDGIVRFQSAIASGLSGLIPGKTYWLELDTGVITNTPNLNYGLQLLGVAVTTSDLHFIYSPPTV